jgi:isopenicillin N synthase-like dioxygenase
MSSIKASSVLPVIDLSDSDVNSLVRQIGDACQSVGFFAVVNHGVDDALIDRAFEASRAFFDLPDAEKLRCKTSNEAEYPYGYERSENLNRGRRSGSRSGTTREEDGGSNDDGENAHIVSKTRSSETKSNDAGNSSAQQPSPRADLKETFSIGPCNPDAGMPPRRFPPHPPELRDALQQYYEQMERLASRLLRLFAVALHLPSQDWFEPLLTRHLSALRILNYYEFEWSTTAAAGGESSLQIRAGEHTDYGALTILRSGGPGLQLRKDGPSTVRGVDGDGAEWVNVPEIPGAFIINIGDMMQRWTNGTRASRSRHGGSVCVLDAGLIHRSIDRSILTTPFSCRQVGVNAAPRRGGSVVASEGPRRRTQTRAAAPVHGVLLPGERRRHYHPDGVVRAPAEVPTHHRPRARHEQAPCEHGIAVTSAAVRVPALVIVLVT